MQLIDLINLFRREVDDTVAPYLWSDEEIIDFANDAQDEACRRARLLIDSTTPELCQLNVPLANEGLVLLDERTLFVRHARIEGGHRALQRATVRDLDAKHWNWRDHPPRPPVAFVTDYETGKLLLWPRPDTDVTLRLTVVRLPLVQMNDGQDRPEINPRLQRSLRFWMMFRAYSKQDSQANDPKKAADSLVLFEQEFGKKSSAIDETWIEREQTDEDGTF
jgi:hypothetical protein